MPQAPPSCSNDTTQRIFFELPGIGIATSRMLRRTQFSSNDSLGTQNLSKRVGV